MHILSSHKSYIMKLNFVTLSLDVKYKILKENVVMKKKKQLKKIFCSVQSLIGLCFKNFQITSDHFNDALIEINKTDISKLNMVIPRGMYYLGPDTFQAKKNKYIKDKRHCRTSLAIII